MPKILAFSGSARTESYNQRLVNIAAQGARQAGAGVTVINLGDFPMPLMNEDLEAAEGLPEAAKAFKKLLVEHDGFLIASPEYNSAFPPLLKNAIDWASRKETPEEPPLVAFKGKTAVIMSASPGALGGLRGLVFLRMLLNNIGITVLPDQQAITQANKAFGPDGPLLDERKQKLILALGETLTRHLIKLSGADPIAIKQ